MSQLFDPTKLIAATNCADEPELTGTTVMAVQFDGGVVFGADSRSTIRDMVVRRITDKLCRVTDSVYCCRTGSSADTQAIAALASCQLDLSAVQHGRQPEVLAVARVMASIAYKHHDVSSGVAAFVVAGWDERGGGQVYEIPIGGGCFRRQVGIAGSGSEYIYGFVDANYKPNMSVAQAVEFVVDSISLAIGRDGYSGGVVRIGVIQGSVPIERFTIFPRDFKHELAK